MNGIYYNAVMFAHHYVSPQNAEIIFRSNSDAISVMIGNALALAKEQSEKIKMEFELGELRRRMGHIALREHRSCFFAYPFQDKFHALRDEIRKILSRKYGVELTATSLGMGNPNVVEDIKNQIAETHFAIADVTGNNPNVLWELGVMIGYRKPVIILKGQEDEEKTPFDLYGSYRVTYHIVTDGATGITEYALLEKGLERNMKLIFQQCPELEKAKRWNG